MELGRRGNHRNQLRDVLLADVVFTQSEHLDHRVNLPFPCGRVLLTNLANLVGQLLFEFCIGDQQVVEQLFHNGLDVGVVGNLVEQVEGLLLDDQVVVLKAVEHGLLVTRHRFVVNVHHLDQLLQSDVPHIVLFVLKEFAENVDAQYTQTLAGLNGHDRSHAFGED